MPVNSPRISISIFTLLIILVFSGYISIALSLLLGVGFALTVGNPFPLKTHWASSIILKSSIVILGLGLNFSDVLQTAKESFNITILSIVFTLVFGYFIGKMFKVEQKLSFLISGGTAICGGSAIAALAPTIRANPNHVIISISIIFLLNALALIIYPVLGEQLGLGEKEFGLWSALGIHDTSSVVGAAASYGEQAMEVATTTKLARALWIVPLVFIAGLFFKQLGKAFTIPPFIILFILATIAAATWPILSELRPVSNLIAKKGMALSLFLIGTSFNQNTLSEIQWRALLQGILLWILVSIFSLWLIKFIN
ncbi:YeiH family protein [Aliikangiella maris]|uniref:Sulfate exporter family transporter n=2 Tax=Aliikangiella maris TaxID=3162458 RepID=A0ABV2BPH7_9GAMM